MGWSRLFFDCACCEATWKGTAEEGITEEDRQDDQHHDRHAESLRRKIHDHGAWDVFIGGHELHISLEIIQHILQREQLPVIGAGVKHGIVPAVPVAEGLKQTHRDQDQSS